MIKQSLSKQVERQKEEKRGQINSPGTIIANKETSSSDKIAWNIF